MSRGFPPLAKQDRLLIILMFTPVLAMADSRDARERLEVVKISDQLASKMDMNAGDGVGFDIDCAFSQVHIRSRAHKQQ